MMTASRILHGLERSSATGREADSMARLGFLEWVFTVEGAATPGAAKKALALAEAQRPESAAARAFVGFLRQATQSVPGAGRRRGRRQRLH